MMKQNNTWKGYSFEELRYQRALTTIKCEIEKEKIQEIYEQQKQLKAEVDQLQEEKRVLEQKLLEARKI